ncbi:hypothetical protein BU17DRAFT_70378 [Hysterangium stoloniferum]|nr:hypothetical protein BU17DRAFT_70378 [Hysterangium stoloniferum]
MSITSVQLREQNGNVIESRSVPIAYPRLSITKYHSTGICFRISRADWMQNSEPINPSRHRSQLRHMSWRYPRGTRYIYKICLGVVSLEAQNDVGKRVGGGGADFFSESEWHVESIDAVAERSVRSGSIASGMSPPPLPRRSETQERMSFGLSLGGADKSCFKACYPPEKDKSLSIASPIQRVTLLFLDTKSSTSAVKPDVEAKPAPLTKPTQGLTTSGAFPSGGVDPASVPLPPSPIDHEMVFDHGEHDHDHDHDHEDEHIKAKYNKTSFQAVHRFFAQLIPVIPCFLPISTPQILRRPPIMSKAATTISQQLQYQILEGQSSNKTPRCRSHSLAHQLDYQREILSVHKAMMPQDDSPRWDTGPAITPSALFTGYFGE